MTKSPFLTNIAHKMRIIRYAKRTIETYLHWIRAFILFNGRRHSNAMSDIEVEAFLSLIVNHRDVSHSTVLGYQCADAFETSSCLTPWLESEGMDTPYF